MSIPQRKATRRFPLPPPVAIRDGRFWNIYFDGERWSVSEVRRLARDNVRNCRQGGQEAGAMVRAARGGLSVAELAERAGRSVDDVRALERSGTPELAALELAAEVYRPLPLPLDLLRRPFDAAGVAATVERARRGRSVEEIEAIIWLEDDLLKRLETPEAWRGVAVARDVLKVLAKHGAKPPAKHPSLAAWYWACQRYR
jgi:transcriptional regulator with XRE-family HTH domain